MTVKEFILENELRFFEELYSLIRVPSISSESSHKPDMVRAAERWKEILLSTGCDRAEVMETVGTPVVYGERIIDPNKKTVLVYGHYDVMPVEPLDLWESDPFEPEIRNGYIYARGADDDKGQSMIQAKGFETALKMGYVDCNVKFILEGEEEVGSASLMKFCEEHKELLSSDVILVSDTGMISEDIPTINVGLRGIAYWDIEVTGPNRDLHSGHFGGAVANPVIELSKLIASVVDEHGHITVPGFYDDVIDMTPDERAMIAQIPFDESAYCKAIEVGAVQGEEGYLTLERNSCRPCFDVCGMWGGHIGEGAKTVLPSKAYAKVSCRLVAAQDYKKISEQFVQYFEENAPNSVKVKVTPSHGGQAYLCPITHPAYQAAEKAVEIAFGKRPLATRRGGSIPIISTFDQVLGTKSILMGFGLERNAIHSPNESFPVEFFRKGVETVTEFYKFYKQ